MLQCLTDVEVWREHVALAHSKKGKIAARRLAKALRRVDAAMATADLPYFLFAFFPREKLLRWIDMCESIESRVLSEDDTDTAEVKAADAAYWLMRKYNGRVSTTKNSSFEKLAATLAGKPNSNFHHYCRAVVARSAKTGSN